MARANALLQAFNRGLISRLALARTDLDRTRLAAEIQTNWMPRTLGSMMLRPGLGFIDRTEGDDAAKLIPFVFAVSDTALIELTPNLMSVLVDDEKVSFPAVTAAITNGAFTVDLTGWTDTDQAGGASSWDSGQMVLNGSGFEYAGRQQLVTVNEPDVRHALYISVERGPVTLLVGSTSGGQEYIGASLGAGLHSLAFTPTDDFYVEFRNLSKVTARVEFVEIQSSGTFTMTSPWDADDLPLLRYDQSGDVIYVACKDIQQYKIERRAVDSWSIVKYEPVDGPFQVENVTAITVSPDGIDGEILIEASQGIFTGDVDGALMEINSEGQFVNVLVGGADQWSDPVRVVGIDTNRDIKILITGLTATGSTITLQYSAVEPGSWVDAKDWTADTSGFETYNDGFDNQIIYYRIGCKAGDYVAGSIVATITSEFGSIRGIVQITSQGTLNNTTVSARVLKTLGESLASTSNWAFGTWSGKAGWPSSVAFHEGRLWWAGKDKIIGSVSDAFESFDDEVLGDAGPIQRSIGFGPVDTIQWLLSLQRLLLGGEGAEFSARSSSLDEPLSPTNFQVKAPTRQGSAAVQAVPVDSAGIYAQRGKARVYMLSFTGDVYDYDGTDLTALVPELCAAGIVSMAVQRQPDTRIHCVLADGTVAILIFDKNENINCWVKFETDGEVEDVAVLPDPNSIEDAVYYVVNREGSIRTIERWALESECRGGTISKLADQHIMYSGASTATITGLGNLEGKVVVAWGAGKDLGTYTVASGQITLSEAVTSCCVGLPYTASYKSTKLAYGVEGTALNQKKRVHSIGLILADCHKNGITYGPDFDMMDSLPEVEDGAQVAENYVWEAYDKEAFTFEGSWDTDSRVCLKAQAPRPCTVLSLVIGMNTNEK